MYDIIHHAEKTRVLIVKYLLLILRSIVSWFFTLPLLNFVSGKMITNSTILRKKPSRLGNRQTEIATDDRDRRLGGILTLW